ncbi:hypothetical protein ES705_20774 [subsurface metagenome]
MISNKALKRLIKEATKDLQNLNEEEIRTTNEKVRFITWIMGFVSLGFVIFISSFNSVPDWIYRLNISSNILIIAIFLFFIISIVSSLLYRLNSILLTGKYKMHSGNIIFIRNSYYETFVEKDRHWYQILK